MAKNFPLSPTSSHSLTDEITPRKGPSKGRPPKKTPSEKKRKYERKTQNLCEIGCGNLAVSNGKCGRHAAHQQCNVNGCPFFAWSPSGGACVQHGGARYCSAIGCSKLAMTDGKCGEHGDAPKCGVAGCQKPAQSVGLCVKHDGGRRCGMVGCMKFAQTGGFCIRHGGGRRCSVEDCHKFAQRKGLCPTHIHLASDINLAVTSSNRLKGNTSSTEQIVTDRRKSVEDTPPKKHPRDPKSDAVVEQKGKKRKVADGICSSSGCTRGALEEGKCYIHGGGRRCRYPGCLKRAKKKGKCAFHRGEL